jgi:type I restriction enzyme R subunit
MILFRKAPSSFAALLKFVEELDTEEKRAVREGLNEENLALFDLLLKPELSTRDRNRIKEVAKSLLGALKAEKLRVDQWREKEATRAAVRGFIYDFLWNEKTGLPLEAYTPADVKTKAEKVFSHIFMQYPNVTPSIYATA